MKRRRHTPEQIVRKLREADRLLAEGKEIPKAAKALEVSEAGVTCWRRLRDWTAAGVWDQLHQLLLAELHAANQLDWSRAVADASHVRAPRGRTRSDQARSTGPGPAPSITS